MPPSHTNLTKVQVQSGVNTQATPTANAGRWSSSNLVRFKDGFLQKLGGWEQLTATTVTGKSRGLHAFADLSGNKYLLTGSSTAAQVYFNGTLYTFGLFGTVSNPPVTLDPNTFQFTGWLHSGGLLDPNDYIVKDIGSNRSMGDTMRFNIPASVDVVTFYPKSYTITSVLNADEFTINDPTLSSQNVVWGGQPPLFVSPNPASSVDLTQFGVGLTSHGKNAGDTFNVDLATSVGGVDLFGPYTVSSVVDANDFFIAVGQPSLFAQTVYENVSPLLLGGIAGTSTPLGQIAYQTPLPGTTVTWSFDNFGQIALLSPNDGALFFWQPPISGTPIAVGVANAPSINGGMFVAMPQAQVISYRAESVSNIQDPLLIRFSDAGNYTNWTADATNQAGSFRLSRGSLIMGGLQAPQVTLIWTDTDLWSMQYIGPPFIYSFNIMQSGCGLIAQRAATTLYGATYWMSQNQFFQFGSSGVAVLPCDVWDIIFNDLDPNHINLINAGSNAAFNEVSFYYASKSGGTGEIDSYVKFNVVSNVWDYGKLDRTSWIDQSIFGTPIGVDSSLLIQQHEIGYDANGVAMTGVFAESGFVDLGDGTDIIFLDQLIPDFKWFGTGGYVIITLYCQSYPGGLINTYGPFPVNQSTKSISLRARARQVAFRIDWGNALGFAARLGANRLRTGSAGRVP